MALNVKYGAVKRVPASRHNLNVPSVSESLNADIIMFSTKDYSKMTRDELVSEEKKLNSQKIPVALLAGLIVGIAVWSATHKGGFMLTIGLLFSALWIGSRYSNNLKGIQAEISRRDTVR